jgi:ankyrin repeat protein
MKLLLEEGADIMDNGKSMPLIIASAKGHIEAMKLLLQEGANIHAAYNGRTPLIEASAGDHVEAVKLLLVKGADNTATNASRSMPLMMACDNGYIEIVKLLLDHGADITTPNNNGLTPEDSSRPSRYLPREKRDRRADGAFVIRIAVVKKTSAIPSGLFQWLRIDIAHSCSLQVTIAFG